MAHSLELSVNAVEAALSLKDANPEAKVVLVSMGPPPAAGMLRELLAMGCDEMSAIMKLTAWNLAMGLPNCLRSLAYFTDWHLPGAADGDLRQPAEIREGNRMKFIVCVKQVPDTSGKVAVKAHSLELSGSPASLRTAVE